MNALQLDQLIKSISVESNLIPFLMLNGWKKIETNSTRWIVLHGIADANNKPLELVFPKDGQAPEQESYVMKAIELLAALNNDPIQLVAQNIVYYDRDMLYVRNTQTDDQDALPFVLATDQIIHIKQVIAYSACSEKEVRPYFVTQNLAAKRVMSDFRFGHTFTGSFGFTIEAPKLPDPPKFVQEVLDLGENFPPPPVNVPFERRVMERIARGLQFSKQAENERDHRVLIREYASGFNSNMCSAIVGMSPDKDPIVEFRIAWSPKIKAGEDIAGMKPIRLRKDGYDILEFAAKQLKSLEPQTVKVVGHVRALTSSDNPQSLGTRRAVVIRGAYPGVRRAVDIIVELDRDGYAKANDAHISWRNVEVTGTITRSGAAWRLSNAQDIRVLE